MEQMIGADVETLRRLASQFEQSAHRLRTMSGSVSDGVRVSAWAGPVAVRFRAAWDSQHSARLRNAAEVLEEGARTLRENAAAQEGASAGLSGGSGAAATPSPQMSTSRSRIGPGLIDPEVLASLGPAAWDSFAGFMSELRREIPGLSGLSGGDVIGAALQFGELTGTKVPWIGAILNGAGAVDLIGRTVSGQASISEWVSAGGELLTAAPNPVTKLVGLNVQMWSLVAEEAAKSDFSSTAVHETASYAADNPGVVIEEVGKAAVQVGSKFFSMLSFT